MGFLAERRMKIGAFAELVLEILGRNTQDYKIDSRVVVHTAQIVVSSIIMERKRNNEPIPSGMYHGKVFDVKYDKQRDRRYIEPKPLWMHFDDAIAYIGYMDEKESFVLMEGGEFANYQRLEAGMLGGRVGAKPEGNRIYLYYAPDMLKETLMIYVPQLIDMDDDDEMFSDSNMDDYVLERTINMLMIKKQTPEDKITDNVSN